MAKAPKQWQLSTNETITSFEAWRHNLTYILTLDRNFAPFISSKWEKRTRANPLRGFVDDTEANVPTADDRKTAAQKVVQLELMLGQVANYTPIITRQTIVRNSTSLEQVWQTIRAHFGFQASGAHFLDFTDIQLNHNERPQDLFQRLMAFCEDNLLKADGSLTHHGETIEEDEELTPSLENLVVLLWLKLVHKDLPRLVKQKYATELRSRTLASMKPEISIALDSLLDELHSNANASVLRSSSTSQGYRYNKPTSFRSRSTTPRLSASGPSCPLCKAKGQPDQHFLSKCVFLPESDRRYLTKARIVQAPDEDSQDHECTRQHDDYPEDEGDPDDMTRRGTFTQAHSNRNISMV